MSLSAHTSKESKMETILNLPETFSFTRAGHETTLALADFPAHILAMALCEGLKSTIGDAASASASVHYETNKGKDAAAWKELSAEQRKVWSLRNALAIAEVGQALMEKRAQALREGDWTTRQAAAEGMSKFDQYRAEYCADRMKFEAGTKKPEKLKAGLEAYAKQAPDMRQKIDKLVQARIENEQAAQGLELDLSF
jgi:hypothetical protein